MHAAAEIASFARRICDDLFSIDQTSFSTSATPRMETLIRKGSKVHQESGGRKISNSIMDQ